MINLAKLSLILLIISATTTRNLQTVYDVIVIGAGSSGVGASVALSEKNINHIIL
jgi:cation diffusion facilitator CzcD-associated flavoprotein CzcO